MKPTYAVSNAARKSSRHANTIKHNHVPTNTIKKRLRDGDFIKFLRGFREKFFGGFGAYL